MQSKKDLFIIAGPCVVESAGVLDETAAELNRICKKNGLKLFFKSSYKKANRTSLESFTGIGDRKALDMLASSGKKYGLDVLTDIHTAEEASRAAEYADVLQIPAFLCRQTELLLAAGATGKIINIKKGQFMAPEDMWHAAGKAKSGGAAGVWLTERGTAFGYHDLVVDFRSLMIMKKTACPIVFDATHSVQRPSAGEQSGGRPEFTPALARAAAAVGIDGLFLETHPDPKNAKSDAATQLPLIHAEELIESVLKIHNVSGG